MLSKDGNLSDIYINEQGRIMFARFSFQYYLDKKFWVEISQCPKCVLSDIEVSKRDISRQPIHQGLELTGVTLS